MFGYQSVLDTKLPWLLRVRTLLREVFSFSFWGFALKDAEFRPLVPVGWGSYFFGDFDFGGRSYWGTFLLIQNKTKTKEIEAITLSFSPIYHQSHSEGTPSSGAGGVKTHFYD